MLTLRESTMLIVELGEGPMARFGDCPAGMGT